MLRCAPPRVPPARSGASHRCTRQRHRCARVAAAPRDPSSRLEDSLAALDRLCAQPEQPSPDECVADTSASAPPSPVTRQVELLLEDDSGAPRPVALTLPLRSAASRLVVSQLELPLGIVFEERDNCCLLAELLPEGSAAGATPRLQPGDVLRAATACVTAMEYGALNLLGGGVGRPRTRVVVFRVDEASAWGDASFGRALAAIQSNSRAGRRAITLVLERYGA